MVWQDTTDVGCGWTQFKYRGFPSYFENFLVCNYGPSGNIWGQPVYDVANKTCNCPCIGCDPETGLCPANCRLQLTLFSFHHSSFTQATTPCGVLGSLGVTARNLAATEGRESVKGSAKSLVFHQRKRQMDKG